MFKPPAFKNSLALRLLKIVFSIYLVITTFITLTQMVYEYQREKTDILKSLQATQTIFEGNLTAAAWTFDSTQLTASLEGIQKIPVIVGVQILNMNKPPAWIKPFPTRLGTILDTDNKIMSVNQSENSLKNKPYIYLISHQFQLKKKGEVIGEVIFYSSNKIILDKIKYLFLNILIAAIIKTFILWLLFIWAFKKFLGEQLNNFCQTMENVDIDNPHTTFLSLKTSNTVELFRIETVFNAMFTRVLESKNKLDNLNKTLEDKVLSRTQELSNKNHQLEELNKEKSEFLAIAVHDLKNPLVMIINLTRLLKNGITPEKSHQYNTLITKSASRMISLIEMLLDVDKIETGNIRAHLIETNLLTIVDDLIEIHSQAAQDKGICIQFKKVEQDYFVLADKLILAQILDNLLSNAIKYSPFNKIVEINLIKKGASIMIEMTDQGQGLTAQDKQKLFVKFSRLSARPTAKENSTGLGLYIAQKLAAMLNTKIQCESVKNQGATFSLDLQNF